MYIHVYGYFYSSGLLSRAAPRLTLVCVDQWMALSTHIRVATGILLYLSCVVAALPTWSPCFESRGPILTGSFQPISMGGISIEPFFSSCWSFMAMFSL